jgi:hypothetical protein
MQTGLAAGLEFIARSAQLLLSKDNKAENIFYSLALFGSRIYR